jgi:NADPH-dependent glutamate synthase beta subunit-like oxidoreductase/Pyruvate/2-oxoacid:ferredoxin oxidoreductase delta subunit
MSVTININGNKIKAEDGMSILEAAQINEIYIPRLCYHPSLGSSHGLKPIDTIYREDGKYQNDDTGPNEGFKGCQLCLVEINGNEGLFTSCDTIVEDGMIVNSETDVVKEARRNNLAEILKDHPHACLQCAQQDGCSRTDCSTNVPESERCCPLLGHCELQKIAQYIGIRQDLSKYVFKGLPKHKNEPLFESDYNLCVSCLRCVRACRELRGVEAIGFVFNKEKTIVGPSKNSNFKESDCRFCGACVEVCPTGAMSDKNLPKGEKEEVLVPCISNCPVCLDIPRYINLINEGNYNDAVAVIRERIPFPKILGQVCFHPCEDKCRRGELDQPMAICALKRFAAENEDDYFKIKGREPTGKKVAIVGSGPSGLTAAYYLALSGHSVTIFEAEEKIGGLLRYAIPNYRLNPDLLDAEMEIFNELNVEFRINTQIGNKITLSDLCKDFQAVFIGTGAWLSKKISVEGSNLQGVEWGLDFLMNVKKNNVKSLNGQVFVIGGGNVAMDVARTAIRLGASIVQLACLECREEMPAHDWEIKDAMDEGVKMHSSWGPKKILEKNGKISGIELIKCNSVFDKRGNFDPKFDSCETKNIDTDKIILAIGQVPNLSWMKGIDTKNGMIKINKDMQTNISNVFAGGEVTRGPASVVEAIADGATAASSIDRLLGGDGNIYKKIMSPYEFNPCIGKIDGFADMVRMIVKKVSPIDRIDNFNMVETCYNEKQAKQESIRCLRCDLRLKILPITFPPDRWLELNNNNIAEVPAVEGVYQLRDENKVIIVIKGTQNIKADLQQKLKSDTKARYFWFEPDPMYTKRESELIQQFLQQFGKMPEGDGEGDDIDDLF